jgi:GTP cyclohydrolase I
VSNQIKITPTALVDLAKVAARSIVQAFPSVRHHPYKVYPIPRGGLPAALAIGNHIPIEIVEIPERAEIIVDDLVDSGITLARYTEAFPHIPRVVLIDKRTNEWRGKWVVFPWEGSSEGSFEDNVTRLLQYVGEDPTRGGLLETPKRVARAWKDWCSGYDQKPEDILKVFEDGGENYDQMIARKDIPIYSHCEHHLAPIVGRCTIAYIPNGKIVGLSKMDRLAHIFSRRLQVQERMTQQIADAIEKHLKPTGVGVWISARHMCVESRGVRHQSSDTITTALKGALLHDQAARAEFLHLARS